VIGVLAAVVPPLGPLWAEVAGGEVVRLDFGDPPAVANTTPGGVAGTPSDHQLFATLGEQVAALLAGHRSHVDVPLAEASLSAKPGSLACRVHAYLRSGAVPAGRTVTYAEVARAVGCPGAARAVGTALARNPWPVVLPCHRVVPAAGGPGGYRGGPAAKAWLLALEQRLAVSV
jgi:methylated-DNA-[protein]-cysteine S-methyltransferase